MKFERTSWKPDLDMPCVSLESPNVLGDVSSAGLTQPGILTLSTGAMVGATVSYVSDNDRESTSVIPQLKYLPELPKEIKECLKKLQNDKIDEDVLYENADQIAEWFTDSSDEFQTTIAAYVRQLFHSYSPIGLRILLSAFCDAEVTINDETLLGIVAGFLKSTDKQLAQAAASCLLLCGKSLGRSILKHSLIEDKNLPHANLIHGIIDLLGID